MDIFSGRWLDGKLGALSMKNHVMRAVNPFLFHIYTKQTVLIVLVGGLCSLLQGRIMAAFMPLAVLSMDFSKDGEHTYLGCLFWTAICSLYWFYMGWKLF